jgi:hypothetical protein
MVRPTEASPSVLSPSTKTPWVPTEAPSNAIPVEVMADFIAKETAPVPVEALSNAEPVAALPSSLRAQPVAAPHSSLRAEPSALHSSPRAGAPSWSIPATLSAIHQGDGVLPPSEHIPFPVVSVFTHGRQDPSASKPSSGTSPSVEPSFRQVSANRDFAGPSLSPSSCAPVDTTSFVNRRLSPRAPEWSPAPGLSPRKSFNCS